jgi:hypothetical protein
MAIICLHISAFLYLLVGGGFFCLLLAEDNSGAGLIFGGVMFLFCLGLIAGIEFVAFGLRQRKFWAWVAGLCIFGLYVPSAFLPLGAFGLWGLLDEGSRKEFGVSGNKGPG